MSEWSGKTRGGVAGYKSFVFIIKYFGISTAYFILRFVVLYFLFFAPKAVKYSYIYLHRRQGFSPFKSFWYIGRMFYKLGQVLIDKVAFLSGLSKKFTFDFDGEEHLRIMADSTGGILIGLHAGSWEIAGHLLERLNTRIHIVMFADEHQRIQNFLSEIYDEKNINFIIVNQDYSHLFEMSKALENKELIAIHGDRFLPESRTISKNLLNKMARFPFGPFLLSVKYNVPVSFVTAMKETHSHYHFYATEPRKYKSPKNPNDREETVKDILNEYIRFMEKILIKYPDQWFNFYDFWEDDKENKDSIRD
ncbi:MAG: acyltransferase [Bacteroidales bacterium]|nr:acyltransferase [Bacteroidales bacterium]